MKNSHQTRPIFLSVLCPFVIFVIFVVKKWPLTKPATLVNTFFILLVFFVRTSCSLCETKVLAFGHIARIVIHAVGFVRTQ